MVGAGALSIRLMERLIWGVFATGNVEVTAIHEECLEHSVRWRTIFEAKEDITTEEKVLKAKGRASRRLLQTMDAFEEEVVFVNDVLIQQEKVLQVSSMYLEPSSFMGSSTARKLKSEFGTRGIERILRSIREHLGTVPSFKKKPDFSPSRTFISWKDFEIIIAELYSPSPSLQFYYSLCVTSLV